MAAAKSSRADGVAIGFAIAVAILVVSSVLARRVAPRLATAFYGMGVASVQRYDYGGAIRWFNAAIFLKHDFAEAYIARGRARVNFRLALEFHPENSSSPYYNLAIEDFDSAIRLNPASAEPYVERGRTYWIRGHEDQALQDYAQAIKVDSGYLNAYQMRATAYEERKEFNLAIRDLTHWIQLRPDDYWVYEIRSRDYEHSGDFDLAIKDDDVTIETVPKSVNGWNNRCWHRAIIGKYTEALEDCNQALALNPNKPDIMDSLGFLYLKMDNPATSITNYNAALAKAPRQATSLYGRGLAELQEGDADAANTDIEAAKAIKPDIADDFAKWGVHSPSARTHPKP